MLKRFFPSWARENPSSTSHRDFSLYSGERQTATKLEEIRRDHVARYQKAINYTKTHYKNDRHLNGLDVFCANGYGTSMLADQLKCWALGIDASKEAIVQAEISYSRPNTLYSEKFFPFTLPINTFDFVTCIESVEHTKHYSELIKVLVSSLKQDGLLFISTPNEEIMPFRKEEMPFHIKHFKHDEFIRIVTETREAQLLTFFGQNVYQYENLERKGLLDESLMALKESALGQFQLYVFKKSRSTL